MSWQNPRLLLPHPPQVPNVSFPPPPLLSPYVVQQPLLNQPPPGYPVSNSNYLDRPYGTSPIGINAAYSQYRRSVNDMQPQQPIYVGEQNLSRPPKKRSRGDDIGTEEEKLKPNMDSQEKSNSKNEGLIQRAQATQGNKEVNKEVSHKAAMDICSQLQKREDSRRRDKSSSVSPPRPSPPPFPDGPSSTDGRNQDRKLLDEISKLKNENKKLMDKNEEDYSLYNDTIDGLSAKVAQKDTEIEQLKMENDKLEKMKKGDNDDSRDKDLDRLQDQVAIFRQELAALGNENEKLTKENEALKLQISIFETQSHQTFVDQQTIEKQTAERVIKCTKIERDNKELKAKMKNFEEGLATEKKVSTILSKDLQKERTTIEQLKNEIADMRKNNVHRDKYRATSDERNHWKSEHESLLKLHEETKIKYTSDLNEISKKYERLQQIIGQRLPPLLKIIGEIKEEKRNLENEINGQKVAFQQIIDSIREQSSTILTKLTKNYDVLIQQNEQLKKEKDNVAMQGREAIKQVGILQGNVGKERTRADQLMEELDRKKEELKGKENEMKTILETKEKEKIEYFATNMKRVNELQTALETKEKEMIDSRNDYVANLKRVNESNSNLITEINNLKEQSKTATEALEAMKSKDGDYEKIDTEIANLKNQLAKKENDLEQIQNQLTEAVNRSRALVRQKNDSDSRYYAQCQAVIRHTHAEADLRSDLNAVRNERDLAIQSRDRLNFFRIAYGNILQVGPRLPIMINDIVANTRPELKDEISEHLRKFRGEYDEAVEKAHNEASASAKKE